MATRPRRLQRRRRQVVLARGAMLVALLLLLAAGALWWIVAGAAPRLEGTVPVAGLGRPVEILRDAEGVPTLTAESRLDLARALGFLHGQERFFQMDLLRRSGAGELSELVGPAALPVDEARRRHRFRARAEAILGQLPAAQRALLEAYAEGVNRGLDGLARRPFEYTLLGQRPLPWRAADTLLVLYAMYFELQEENGWAERRRALARASLGPALAEFLYPHGTPDDAALDGSELPEPSLPSRPGEALPAPAAPAPAPPPAGLGGSNAFAVAGSRTATGAAMVASDMHLALRVPGTWYRARLKLPGSLDLDGLTLPGTPFLVAGSNGRVAWAYTAGYFATGDDVLLDPVPDDPLGYLTPDGPRRLSVATESLCPAGEACRPLRIEESVWGPVVAHAPDGRRIVWRWAAQDAGAIELDGLLALETAGSVRAALDAAHHAGLPQLDMLIGDRDGHIAWTVAGLVPRRIGLEDGTPQSWADGSHGWAGYLTPAQIPEVIDPPDGALWVANNRPVGGEAYRLLGDGGSDGPERARQIRDDLKARERFAEADLLAIQLDARAPALARWQALLAEALARRGDPRAQAMLAEVRRWGGAALTGSVGYRLVRSFEEEAVRLIYGGFGAPIRQAAGADGGPLTPSSWNWPAATLLERRPPGLVPPPFHDWDELVGEALKRLEARVQAEAGGDLAAFTWGARNHAGIRHPLSAAVPLLARLTDPPDEPLPGDAPVPRVAEPGFGASERFVVSPGHEGDGIFEMPGGQSGSPAAPYYLAGHRDWVEGRPSPFLPGPPRWTLRLVPG